MSAGLTRRAALAGAGALVLSFSLSRARGLAEPANSDVLPKPSLPGSLAGAPRLDAWIRVDAQGGVTILTGKAELGQGLKIALLQIAAEELKVEFSGLKLITADTGLTADEGYTAASHSIQDSGTAIRNAAAQVREILVSEAARRLNVDHATLRAEKGVVVGANGISIAYGELVRDELLQVDAAPMSKLTATAEFTVMNRPIKRIDIPAKISGAAAYVQDMRLPGMLHGRMVRPPSPGATLERIDSSEVERMAGVVKVVRNGNFLAVVAEREWTAIEAMRRLATKATWRETASLPDETRLAATLMALPSQDSVILDRGRGSEAGHEIEAIFTRPYLAHGSIGPSCAIAEAKDGSMTVWTHSQGVFPLRKALAEMLRMPLDKVRCIHAEGAGCYGHNGADDVAADAAVLAAAIPGSPVRVQWMREQEHAWEPFGPAMATRLRAGLGQDGKIAYWRHEVWSQSHMMRPGPAGTLLAARAISDPFPPAPPVALPQPEGGGDRNAIPLYTFPDAKVVSHFLPEAPLRGSSMRSLGGYLNAVAIESMMDDLARAAGQDPVAFRLLHLDNPRARAVIEKAAEAFGWHGRKRLPTGGGYGFAFAQYKNQEAFCAIALEIAVDSQTGDVVIARVTAAVDTGEVVNPDGVRNQIEGGIVQSSSWTLFERVTFDRIRVTSIDWSAYPIMRFANVPRAVDVHIIDQPGAPFLGVAEAVQGPTGAALANAIRDAIGLRLYDLPLSAERIRNALNPN